MLFLSVYPCHVWFSSVGLLSVGYKGVFHEAFTNVCLSLRRRDLRAVFCGSLKPALPIESSGRLVFNRVCQTFKAQLYASVSSLRVNVSENTLDTRLLKDGGCACVLCCVFSII